MSDVDEMLQLWKDGIKEADNEADNEEKDYKSNLIHEEWISKWKRFQPLMWKVFRWAYKVKRTLFIGAYPVAVSTEGECINMNEDGSVTFECRSNKFEFPIIDAKAKELMENI